MVRQVSVKILDVLPKTSGSYGPYVDHTTSSFIPFPPLFICRRRTQPRDITKACDLNNDNSITFNVAISSLILIQHHGGTMNQDNTEKVSSDSITEYNP